MKTDSPNKKKIISWALYDWANSAFATAVMAGLFPVFFKQYWAEAKSVTESTFLLGSLNSAASILVAVLAPILGAIADRGGSKRYFLMFFATMGIVMTGGLYLVGQGEWVWALLLYLLAALGFSGGNIFYDALLLDVADRSEVDRVSALGFGLGYLGGGLLFAFDVLMITYPQFFGIPDSATAVKLSFLSVAVWWALFSIPVFLFVKERQPSVAVGWLGSITEGLGQLKDTFGRIRQLRMTFLFLLAYWLYIDGVDTIVRMAVDYGLSLGFDADGLMLALLVTQFVGFPAAIVFGRIGERYGARRGIMGAIGVYLLIIIWASQMEQVWEFYGLAIAIGLVQGGIQALSRSYYSGLIPRDKAGEFYGFYNMLGKFAAVMGPIMMGGVSVMTGSPRLSILSILVLFVAGAILLMLVDEDEGRRQARLMEQAEP